MTSGRLKGIAIGVAAACLAAPAFSAELGRDDPEPLLALVRDLCVQPKNGLDEAIAAAQGSMPLKPQGRQRFDDVVSWDASGDPSRFGVFYVLIAAVGGDLANALIAHAVGDVGAFERDLRAMSGVTLSPRKADEFSNPNLGAWSLTASSGDGLLSLELSAQNLRLGETETNGYSVTCGSKARR